MNGLFGEVDLPDHEEFAPVLAADVARPVGPVLPVSGWIRVLRKIGGRS
jgi:hypothetical protein